MTMEETIFSDASKKHLTPTVYHEAWWLQAASDGAYREARVTSGGSLIGRLPYLPIRKAGRSRVLLMPPMTHILGPSISLPANARSYTRCLREFSVTSDLIAQLPSASHVWFQLHPEVTTTLAFEAAGFSSGIDYRVEIKPDLPAALWRQMRDKTRNVIRRAQERLDVVESTDPERFLDLYEANLRARGLRNRHDRRICENVIAECLRRAAGRLLFATDQKAAPHSAIFTVWDHRAEYYHMSTRTIGSDNGAVSLLIWTAIQHAASKGLIFDTEGLQEHNMTLLTGFGGSIRPLYFVSKTSAPFGIAKYVASRLSQAG